MTALPHIRVERKEIGSVSLGKGRAATVCRAFSSEGRCFIERRRRGLLTRTSYEDRQEFLKDWTAIRRDAAGKE